MLTPPPTGGELILRTTRRLVTPKRFSTASDNTGSLRQVADGVYVGSGLRAGEHLVSPVYEGGIVGPPVRADVVADQSMAVSITLPFVGGVLATVSRELCGTAADIIVSVYNKRLSLKADVALASLQLRRIVPGRGVGARYLSSFADGVWLGQTKRVDLLAGDNQVDWSIEGGSLVVDVTGWDRRGDLELRYSLAAAYAFGLVKKHPYRDGNKRTGFLVMATFLDINGYELDATDEDVVTAIISLASGALSETMFTEWIRRHTGLQR